MLKSIIDITFAQSKKFILNELNLKFAKDKTAIKNKIVLKDISTSIYFEDRLLVIFSYESRFLEHCARKMSFFDIDELSKKEREEYFFEVALEIINIVCANSLNLLPKDKQNIAISTPKLVDKIEYNSNKNYSIEIKTLEGKIILNYIYLKG